MQRLSRHLKPFRYLWHAIARLGETAFFLVLLPLILVGAMFPDQPAPASQKQPQGKAARPRP